MVAILPRRGSPRGRPAWVEPTDRLRGCPLLCDLGQPHETLRFALKDDAEAIQFVQMLVRVCDVWDDLIDRDANVPAEAIHQAFYLALCGIPNNAFYRQHLPVLQPLMVSGVLSWWGANALERQPGRRGRRIAYVARSQIAEVITLAAVIVGGIDWARSVAADIKLLIHSDDPDEYMKETERKHGMAVTAQA